MTHLSDDHWQAKDVVEPLAEPLTRGRFERIQRGKTLKAVIGLAILAVVALVLWHMNPNAPNLAGTDVQPPSEAVPPPSGHR